MDLKLAKRFPKVSQEWSPERHGFKVCSRPAGGRFLFSVAKLCGPAAGNFSAGSSRARV